MEKAGRDDADFQSYWALMALEPTAESSRQLKHVPSIFLHSCFSSRQPILLPLSFCIYLRMRSRRQGKRKDSDKRNLKSERSSRPPGHQQQVVTMNSQSSTSVSYPPASYLSTLQFQLPPTSRPLAAHTSSSNGSRFLDPTGPSERRYLIVSSFSGTYTRKTRQIFSGERSTMRCGRNKWLTREHIHSFWGWTRDTTPSFPPVHI